MAIELELTTLNIVATSFGLFLLVWGSISHFIKERLYLGEAPFALLFGIGLSFYGLPPWLRGNPGMEQDPLDEFSLGLSRFIIGTQLVLVGVQLPYKYPLTEWRSLAVLLLPVMTISWLVTTALTWLCLPDVSILVALVLASCATPTDPVLSNAIVKGSFANSYVSPRLRNLISAESGANDGFALPFLYIAVHLIKEASTGEALRKWVLETILYSVGFSVVLGFVLGAAANYLLKIAAHWNLIDKESFLLYAVALSIFVVGFGGILHVDDLLSCFVAGNALTWDDWYRRETEDDELQNVVDLLCNCVYFTFVGATIPWTSFNDPENGVTPVRLALLCVGVLLLRRLPIMLLSYSIIPQVHDVGEAVFSGYFGPIGAGAIFYSALVLDEFKHEADAPWGDGARIRILVKPVIYALVLSSVLGHTLMVPIVKAVFKQLGIESIKASVDGKPASLRSSSSEAGDSDVEDEAYEQGAGPAPGTSDMSEAGETSRLSWLNPSEQEQPSWRISSGHKLGPHVRRRLPNGQEVVHDLGPQHSAWHRGERAHSQDRSSSGGGGSTLLGRRRRHGDYGALEDGRRHTMQPQSSERE